MSARVAKNVKNWRKRFKWRVRQALGGRCVGCGYDRCEFALEIHHIDKEQKEISFASIQAQPRAAASLIPELKKCVLLCKVCHVEVHAGVRINPTQTSFDEGLYLSLIAK